MKTNHKTPRGYRPLSLTDKTFQPGDVGRMSDGALLPVSDRMHGTPIEKTDIGKGWFRPLPRAAGEAAPVYAVTAGRCITINGKPFVTLNKCQGVDPIHADCFARLIPQYFNAHAGLVEALEEMLEQFGHYCEHTEDPAEIAAQDKARAALQSAKE